MTKGLLARDLIAGVIASVLMATVTAGPFDNQPFQPPTSTTTGAVCEGQADIVFILDASISITSPNYDIQKNFLASVVDQFKVGPTSIHVSAIVFSTTASLEFNFSNFTTNADVRQAILVLPYQNGVTYTGKALKLAREQAFSILNGARPDVPKLAVVLTDGGSTNPTDTSLEATVLKSSGVTVMVVGIGSGVNIPELDTIASSPSLVFKPTNFDVLDAIKSNLVQIACQEKEKLQANKITCVADSCAGKPDGNYPACDPECRQGYYYICAFEHAYKMSCGLGWYVATNGAAFTARMVFSPSIKNCVLESEACPRDPYQYAVVPASQTWTGQGGNRACINPSNTCRGKPDGNYPLCYPECQSGYYISCSSGEAIQMPCVQGWYVDNQGKRFASRMVYNPSTDTCEQTSSYCTRGTPVNTDDSGRGTDPEEQCDAQADIMLCLDSSGSIGQLHYNIMANFVASLTTNFQVGPTKVRFAAAVYSESVSGRFTFSTYQTNAEVFQDLSQIPYLSNLTNTAAVLTYARTTVFPTARVNISRLAVVITDGFSDSPEATALEADKLKQTGVTVLALGVGSYVNQTELLAIASSPSLVFNVSSFNGLMAIKNQLTAGVCQAAVGCTAESKADALFILDSSGSITEPNWQLMLGFAANITKLFTVGVDAVLFSAISFSDDVTRNFGFTTHLTRPALRQGLLALQYIAGGTNTAVALREARAFSFTSANGARSNVPKVAIVITDGNSNDGAATAIEAANLKSTGATVIAIGVGNSVGVSELETIASSAGLVFQTQDFRALATIRDVVVKTVCQS